MKGSNYYFDMVQGSKYIDEGEYEEAIIMQNPTTFFIVPKSRYDSTGRLDCGIGKDINPILFPLGFYEQAEAVYGYNGDDEDGRQKIISLGFVEKELGFDMEF